MIYWENLKKYKLDLLALVFISLLIPLFFYKLGQTSLTSFDEAWYADIARNILKTGQIFDLKWNGMNYIDHPPAGFWMIALSQLFLGYSEFSARFAPAFSGLLSLFLIYLLGKELFNRAVGLISAIALASAPWFLFRARSGNLDVILTMFFLLTIYLAVKASKNKNFLIPFAISFTLLLLTKTIVPLTIIPALIIIFWKSKVISIKNLLIPFSIIFVTISYWFNAQLDNHPHFVERLFFIGLPGVGAKSPLKDNLLLVKNYLHSGIGKWFWPGVLSMILGIFFKQRRFLMLSALVIAFFAPFLTSNKGHIWHMIPMFPFLILAFFGFAFTFSEKVLSLNIFNNLYSFIRRRASFILNILPYSKKLKLDKKIIQLICIVFIFAIGSYYSFLQIRRAWYEFIDIPAFVTDEAKLSKIAGTYPYRFYIDGDWWPAAIYYSGKNVELFWRGFIDELFKEEEQFTLITFKWRLDQAKIKEDQYKIVAQDRDKLLIIKK